MAPPGDNYGGAANNQTIASQGSVANGGYYDRGLLKLILQRDCNRQRRLMLSL